MTGLLTLQHSSASTGAMEGFDIVLRERVGSTNDELRAMTRTGAPHGTVLRAVEQVSGRGRQGRHWVSPPGNLYMSVLLRCDRPARRTGEAGFLLALAAADAVDAALPPGAAVGTGRARLKWPNDVQVRGAKIAGVLTELLDEGGGVAIVAGVGLNVSYAPNGLLYKATSLHAEGAMTATAENVMTALLPSLRARWAEWLRDGFGPVRNDWRRRGPARGTVLAVSLPGETAHGTFEDLDGDGALLLRTENGVQRFVAGDVVASDGPRAVSGAV